MSGMRTLSLALALSITIVHAAQADSRCTQAAVFPAGGNIPADHVRLLYSPSRMSPLDETPAMPRLYRLEGTTKVSVPYEIALEGDAIWLTPTIEQPLGTQLVLESDTSRCAAPLVAAYSITEKRPLPNTLGSLTATSERGMVSIGECTEASDVAYADLHLTLSDRALPFASLLRYRLYVDGRAHTGSIDRVYADCSELDAGARRANALTPGPHLVHVGAQIGEELLLATPDVQVDLHCDGPALSSAD
jgi:hypothetical protein